MSRLSIVILLCFSISIKAQIKLDNTWVLGYPPNDSIKKFGGVKLSFGNGIQETERFNIFCNVGSSTITASDKEGHLKFFSNGCSLYDSKGQLLLDGDSLNTPGVHFKQHCWGGFDYWIHQGLMVLPEPGQDNSFFLFTLRFDNDFLKEFFFPTSLLLTKIHVEHDTIVEVISKNELLLQDTFCDHLTAVRHGNGRDWWIYLPKLNSTIIHAFLLTPNGLKGPFIRDAKIKWLGSVKEYQLGKASFSPDGSMYARVDNRNDLQVLLFDRCSGEFSCPRTARISLPDEGTFSLAFSKSSRFLYVTTGKKVLQFDTWIDDLQQARLDIGEWDGYFEPPGLATTFYQPQLAPDGKIYITAPNGIPYLHTIEYPDKKGMACQFVNRGLPLPVFIGFCLPNNPYYNLYDFQSSPCDTLKIDAPFDTDTTVWFSKLATCFPNPANGVVNITASDCKEFSVLVTDCLGRISYEANNLSHHQPHRIDTHDWAAGLYFIVINFDNEAQKTYKLSIVH